MMDIKRILVAVDPLSSRDAAFERALSIAKSSGAELYVLHAVPLDQSLSFGAAERIEERRQLRARAEEAGVLVQTVEQHGDPAEIIQLHADARGADLIVMGVQPRRGWRQRSAIAEKVMRQTMVPTLLVSGDRHDEPTVFRHALVALDLSADSRAVLEGALALAPDESARLTVLHAAPGVEAADAVRSPARWKIPEYRSYVLDDARDTMERIVSGVPGKADTHLEVTTGFASRSILDRAADVDADLIVMGRSRGFKVLGSTALRVLRQVDRALLVIPSTEQRRARVARPLAA